MFDTFLPIVTAPYAHLLIAQGRSLFLETAPVIIFVGLLVFVAHWLSGIFSRTMLPDVLMLILIGLLIGPVLKIVTPAHFGAVGPVFVTVALVIILFEGGLGLRPEVLQRSMRGTMALTLVNFLVTLLAVAAIARYAAALDWMQSLMLGAILGGTSSAVVVPMVPHLKLRDRSRTILVLESALSDVLCIVVALGLLEASVIGGEDFRLGPMVGRLIASFLMAAALGVVGAFGWSMLLHRVRTLQNSIFTTPAFVFMVFGVVEVLGYSGAIAALAFGIVIGNSEFLNIRLLRQYASRRPITLNETERVFFAEVVFLLKTFFFVYVGLSIELRDPWSVFFGGVLTLAVFFLRIPVVWLSVERDTPRGDAGIMAAMVPKGLAAAVLASIPLQRGIEGGEFIQNATYAVVLFSIFLASILIFLLQKTRVNLVYGLFFRGFKSTAADEESFRGS